LATGETDDNTLIADTSAIHADAVNEDLTSTTIDCQNFSTDLTAIQGHAPIPDAGLEQRYASALSDYNAAASDCANGVAQLNSGLISQMTSDFTAGNSAMSTLTNEITARGNSN